MIRVLIVDDEAETLDLHRRYVERLDGFAVVAEAAGARGAAAAILAGGIDLVLLDLTMPDGSGLDVLRHVRARGATVDVIAITSVRDADAVRQAVALGAAQYLVKPFAFATFAERMAHYRGLHERARAAGPRTQSEIDDLFHAPRTGSLAVPKGLSPATLARVTAAVRAAAGLSAAEAAAELGLSRVAARRYLEHLADEGALERVPRYGTRGRPETEYRWRAG